jgi:hypothetical protein
MRSAFATIIHVILNEIYHEIYKPCTWTQYTPAHHIAIFKKTSLLFLSVFSSPPPSSLLCTKNTWVKERYGIADID